MFLQVIAMESLAAEVSAGAANPDTAAGENRGVDKEAAVEDDESAIEELEAKLEEKR
jgi:hypothetical protein